MHSALDALKEGFEVFVDLIKGDQKSPEFAALNPNMRMPVIKDGHYG